MKIMAVLSSFLFTTIAFSRPITINDVHIKGFSKAEVALKKDFSFTLKKKFCQKLLTDSEIAVSAGTVTHSSNRAVSEIISLNAWTELDETRILVKDENIVSGKASTSLNGFDDIERYTISFPSVQKGARLCYEVNEKFKSGSVKNYFEIFAGSDFSYYEKGSGLVVESEIPLFHFKRDINANWTFQVERIKGIYRYSFLVNEDYYDGHTFENYSDESHGRSPVLVLKSHNSYQSKPFRDLAGEIEKKIEESTLPPEALERIAEIKFSELTVKDQAENAMAWVIDNVRYMGDWRSSSGLTIPRSIEDIIETRYGDCKDLSLLTVKMLRELGLKATFAVVRRGLDGNPFGIRMSASHYLNTNHAIVYLEDTKTFVDPTNTTAIAQTLLDIADRDVLVLAKEPYVSKTPIFENTEGKIIDKCVVTYKGENSTVRCNEKYSGFYSAYLLQNFFRQDRTVLERNLIESMRIPYINYEFHKLPTLWDRIPENYEIDYQWTQLSTLLQTPQGQVIPLPEPYKEIFELKPETRQTGIQVPFNRVDEEYVYSGKKATHGVKDLNVKLVSPWMLIQREVKNTGKSVKLRTSYETIKTLITPQEFVSKEFSKFQEDYKNLINSKAIVIR
ncbi:MAG: transglutaminase family protein [Oligoflexales bacterium]